MSRDIFVQDIPAGIHSVADIPDDFEPAPLAFSPQHARTVVARVRPEVNFVDGVGHLDGPGISLEIAIDDDEPLESFAIFDRSSDRRAADEVIAAILTALTVRAFDSDSDSGLFEDSVQP